MALEKFFVIFLVSLTLPLRIFFILYNLFDLSLLSLTFGSIDSESSLLEPLN